MPSFDIAVANTLLNEGGLTDDPNDPGGLTNFGISLAAYPGLGPEGIRSLTEAGAKAIYLRDFWTPLHLDGASQLLANHVFDHAVNAGLGGSVMLLQALAGIATDGRVGPATEAAYSRVAPADFRNARIGYYVDRAVHGQKRYLQTWLNRLPVCDKTT